MLLRAGDRSLFPNPLGGVDGDEGPEGPSNECLLESLTSNGIIVAPKQNTDDVDVSFPNRSSTIFPKGAP